MVVLVHEKVSVECNFCEGSYRWIVSYLRSLFYGYFFSPRVEFAEWFWKKNRVIFTQLHPFPQTGVRFRRWTWVLSAPKTWLSRKDGQSAWNTRFRIDYGFSNCLKSERVRERIRRRLICRNEQEKKKEVVKSSTRYSGFVQNVHTKTKPLRFVGRA